MWNQVWMRRLAYIAGEIDRTVSFVSITDANHVSGIENVTTLADWPNRISNVIKYVYQMNVCFDFLSAVSS